MTCLNVIENFFSVWVVEKLQTLSLMNIQTCESNIGIDSYKFLLSMVNIYAL